MFATLSCATHDRTHLLQVVDRRPAPPGAPALLGLGTNRRAWAAEPRAADAQRERSHGSGEWIARVPYLMKSISEYFGSGQRSSATIRSRRSAIARTPSIAGTTSSRM